MPIDHVAKYLALVEDENLRIVDRFEGERQTHLT